MKQLISAVLTVVLAAMTLPVRLSAGEDAVMAIDWSAMRARLAGSEGWTFHIVMADGRRLRTSLLRVEDDGLVLQDASKLPRSEVAALKQTGRRGWGRVIATAVGAALMIAVIAHPEKRTDTTDDKRYTRGEAAASGSFFVGIGYLIGFCADKPHREFRPLP